MIAGLFIECVRVAVFMGVLALLIAPLIYWIEKAMDEGEK